MTIADIIRKELIGKTVRICTYNLPIKQQVTKIVKKSSNVTDKQLEENPRRFGIRSTKTINIGSHKKFENHKVVAVEIYGSYDDAYIGVTFENGHEVHYNIDDEIPTID